MASIVRSSKFRHVYGVPYKRESSYENLRISISAWDTNYLAVNPKYLSVNWDAGGGGAFCVVPLDMVGKLPGVFPLFTAHSGAVMDTAFSPFDDSIIASGAEDHQVMIWRVPEDLCEREEDIIKPLLTLGGHGRKVGHVVWNPVAGNVLAVSSSDRTVKIWDLEQGKVRQELKGFGDTIMSIAWNHNGTLLAATCRDKRLRIFDARSGELLKDGASHTGVKGSRVVWLGRDQTGNQRLVTTGFARGSGREIFLWDAQSLEQPLSKVSVDMSAGMLMPFYDAGSNMLFVAGKGDGNVRYYEYADDKLYSLAEFMSPDPQRGMAVMPKRGVDVTKCEVIRLYKVASNSHVEPVSFRVPRKAETFQADIYPPVPAGKAVLTAEQFFAGQEADPVMVSAENLFNNGPLVVGDSDTTQIAFSATEAPASVPTPVPVSVPAPAPAAAPVAQEPLKEEEKEEPKPVPVTSNDKGDKELSQLRDEVSTLKEQLAKIQQEVAAAQSKEQEARKAADEKELELTNLRNQTSTASKDTEKQIEQLKTQLADAKTKTDSHEKTTEELQAQLKAAIEAANALALAAEKAADSL